MPKTKSYDRPIEDQTSLEIFELSILAAEKPTAPVAVAAGTTGKLDCRIQCDPSGAEVGAQDLYKLDTETIVDPVTGVIITTFTVTPIKGDGTPGTQTIITVPHDQTMDEWEEEAGKPRGGSPFSEVLTLRTDDTTTLTGEYLLKAGRFYKGVAWEVIEGITDGTTFSVGDESDVVRFAIGVPCSQGTSGNTMLEFLEPWMQSVDSRIKITVNTTPSAGKVKLTVYFEEIP